MVVTGGAGFIGSHIAETLIARGYEVVVIDNLSTSTGEHLTHIPSALFVHCDINDTEQVADACAGADTIFHVAAIPGVPISIKDPEGTYRSNVEGVRSIMRAAETARVRRVVLSSSAAVYGNTDIVPTSEDVSVSPLSPYASQKYEAESIVLGSEIVEGAVLRYFNVFGERQDPSSQYSAVIPLFIKLIREGKSPMINGSGSITRDYVYVSNIVEANILAATVPEAKGTICNIGCGREISLDQLVAAINESLGTHVVPTQGPTREGDIMRSYADITRARSVLGYEPKVTFEEGIERTIKG